MQFERLQSPQDETTCVGACASDAYHVAAYEPHPQLVMGMRTDRPLQCNFAYRQTKVVISAEVQDRPVSFLHANGRRLWSCYHPFRLPRASPAYAVQLRSQHIS